MSCVGACAEAARSCIHLSAILQRPPLGKPPGRLQSCAHLSAVQIHLAPQLVRGLPLCLPCSTEFFKKKI